MSEEKNQENNVMLTLSDGIKCDNPNCDYTDDSVTLEQLESFIDKPCPKCGENLLTQQDYDNVIAVLEVQQMLNAMSPEELKAYNDFALQRLKELGLPEYDLIKDLDPEAKALVSIDTHGVNKITKIELLDEHKQNTDE